MAAGRKGLCGVGTVGRSMQRVVTTVRRRANRSSIGPGWPCCTAPRRNGITCAPWLSLELEVAEEDDEEEGEVVVPALGGAGGLPLAAHWLNDLLACVFFLQRVK